ncbi:MAG: 3-isopropylmalate dehydratase small subunit [Methanomicrobiales archaeon]|nr:3-isopropylmalate dehydratase small subunit [Methanomicrobiales archaeon]
MRVWKFGDDVDTDAIIQGKYLTFYKPEELAKHAFEGVRPEFAKEVKWGDAIVAGRNFGCGSSREHAPLALLGSGVSMVIAKSFARIFYRNAVNTGLLVLVSEETDAVQDGAEIEVNMKGGWFESGGRRFRIEPIPAFMKEIVSAGGLVPYARGLKEVPLCTGSRR